MHTIIIRAWLISNASIINGVKVCDTIGASLGHITVAVQAMHIISTLNAFTIGIETVIIPTCTTALEISTLNAASIAINAHVPDGDCQKGTSNNNRSNRVVVHVEMPYFEWID